MAASWVERLNQENGRLYKEKVLTEANMMARLGDQTAERFLVAFRWAYDPMITFGVKQVNDTVGITDAENPWQDFTNLLLLLSKRKLTGNAAREKIEAMSYRFDSNEWNNFCAPIIRKDMRVGVTATTVNKVVDKEYHIPVFACQLATDCENRPEMKGKMRIEPKLDGVRVLMYVNIFPLDQSNTIAYSRNGKIFENFSHIENEIIHVSPDLLKNGSGARFILDGEVVSTSFQNLMRQARRKKNACAKDSVFHVFDIIPVNNFIEGHYNSPLWKRAQLLKQLEPVFNKTQNVRLVPHIDVDLDTKEGWEAYNKYAEEVINDGYEGVMIKSLNAPYLCTRNRYWLKYKPTITVDLEVIGVEEGTGKHTGKLGALVCNGVDQGREITVNVGSGFSDTEREEIWQNRNQIVSSTVEILADAVTQNQNNTYSLRFPRFVRFRDDK